jgi:hypothetical protein
LRRRLTPPNHVLADTGLADIKAELQQFAVNARRAPQRVRHSANKQIAENSACAAELFR